MKQMVLSIMLIWLVSCLSSLEICDPQGNIRIYNQKELEALPQEAFITNVQRGTSQVTNHWKGIKLLPWLNELDLIGWHSITFVSIDGYEISMHRAELESMPVWLAFSQNDLIFALDELRLVFPELRDRFWVRALAKIQLVGYEPAPAPHQIRIVKSLAAYLEEKILPDANGSINCLKLMNQEFHSSEGSLIILDKKLRKLRLEYDKTLKNASLVVNSEALAELELPDLSSSLLPREIVYLQAGPYALLQADQYPRLLELGEALGWESFGTPNNSLATFKKLPPEILEPDFANIGSLFPDDLWLILE
ncbi:MAG: hypothetical protein PHI68_01535 [Candidatus Cloacimonetes bacterium]|nr:hypothetical protein [Candidatus Cloacimonadota bacterium]